MKRIIITGVSALFVLVCGVGVTLFVYKTKAAFPPLAGPYHVGKVDTALTDMSRKDVLGADPSQNRKIKVTIYYPTDPSKGAHYAPYATGRELKAAVAETQVPSPVLLAFLHPHTFIDVPISSKQGTYPVLLFSPGWGTMPLSYSALLEQVASHGYVIVAISHTDSTDYTVFPDGTVVLATHAGSDPDKYAHSTAQLYTIRKQVGNVWLGDVRFVLNQLGNINATDVRFKGRLNLQKIGMFGHSFGGAIAAQAEADNSQILAAINIDGEPISRDTEVILNKPFMMMTSDISDASLKQQGITRAQMTQKVLQGDAAYKDVYFNANPGYTAVLQGSTHATFESDTALMASAFPVLYPSDIRGNIDGSTAVLATAKLTVDFFDDSLAGIASNGLRIQTSRSVPVVFGTYANPSK